MAGPVADIKTKARELCARIQPDNVEACEDLLLEGKLKDQSGALTCAPTAKKGTANHTIQDMQCDTAKLGLASRINFEFSQPQNTEQRNFRERQVITDRGTKPE